MHKIHNLRIFLFSALACFALVVGGGRWGHGYLSVLVGRVSFLYFSLVFYPFISFLSQRYIILDRFNELAWVRVRNLSLNPSSIRLIPYLIHLYYLLCFVVSVNSYSRLEFLKICMKKVVRDIKVSACLNAPFLFYF